MLANNHRFNKRQAEIVFYAKHGNFVSEFLLNRNLDLSCYTCTSINPIDREIYMEVRSNSDKTSPVICRISFKSDNFMGYGGDEQLYCRTIGDDMGRTYTAKNMHGANAYSILIHTDP